MSTRATISFTEAGSEALERLSQKTEKSKTEVVRDALALLDYFYEKTKEEGMEIGLIKDGKIVREVKIL